MTDWQDMSLVRIEATIAEHGAMTLAQLAACLDLSIVTLRKWARYGLLRSEKQRQWRQVVVVTGVVAVNYED